MELTGKTVLVTGAAGSIGSLITRAMLTAGAAHVIALDVNQEKLTVLEGRNITTLCCDLTNFVTLLKTLQQVYTTFPVIDVLINSAGLLYSKPLANIMQKDEEQLHTAALEWQQCIAANLSSVFYVSQIVAGRMLKTRTKGVLLNISSVCAEGNAGQSAYSASKAGVNALTTVWAKELAPLGIRTVAIAPGYIDTDSTHRAVADAQLQGIIQRIPLKKLGQPSAIIQAILFAIQNDYINGTVIDVNGGLSL